MKNYVGRKCKGFRFEDGIDDVNWARQMETHIGEIGEIIDQDELEVEIKFEDVSWLYPISLIEEHLIPENYIRNSIFVGLDAGRDVTEGDNIVIIGDNITSLDKSQKDVLFLNDKVLIGRTIQGVPFNLFDVLMQNVFGEFGENVSYGASSVRDTTTGCSSIAIGIPTKVDEGSKLDIQGTTKSPEIPQLGEGVEMEVSDYGIDWCKRKVVGQLPNGSFLTTSIDTCVATWQYARPIQEVKKYTKEELVKILGHDFEII
jgi:hypothetical protein